MSDFEARTIKIGDRDVVLDPQRLKFNETTLSEYIESEAGWVDHFGSCLADAEYIHQRLELEYDTLYAERFKERKENGDTDKLAEANTKADPDVETAKKNAMLAKHKVRLLQQHLRSWDRAHENAQSRGHFLRKEMDKLNKDIYTKTDNFFEQRLEDIVKEVDIDKL